MCYLVTGGAGFLGSLLCEGLARRGHDVVILDRVYDAELAERFAFAQVDLRDSDAVKATFAQRGPFDGVFHVAAMLAHAIKDKRDLWDSNVTGTRNAAEAAVAHGTPCLVYMSSNCVYKMLAESFVFDTTRIREELGWCSTKTNIEMLTESYIGTLRIAARSTMGKNARRIANP